VAAGAAFFDLDRTLLSRSSSLALAGTFRRRGLIGRRQLAQAALAQILFARFGAGQAQVGQSADRAVSVLAGLSVEVMRGIVAEAWPSVLRPLVYREAVELAESHSARDEKVFVVSAALAEVVETISSELGFDGALGSRAEVEEGMYTGRLERRLYGLEKRVALEELAGANGLDLASSTGYSDSHTDLPFLEAMGHPVAVNPDRALRRVVRERGWPSLRFRRRLGAA
jgi:HAD superfamily hydrolase (TIGR01490 family)